MDKEKLNNTNLEEDTEVPTGMVLWVWFFWLLVIIPWVIGVGGIVCWLKNFNV